MNITVEDFLTWCLIRDYDLYDVERYYVEKHNLLPSTVREVSDELRRYLFLCYLDYPHGSRTGMTACPVDDFWHFFLMFTPTYREFVEKAVGHFVNHNPALYWKPEMAADAAVRHRFTAGLYREVFDEKPLRRLWMFVPSELSRAQVMPGSISGNAELYTPKGMKKAKDVRPNDLVANSRGGWSNVTACASWCASDNRFVRFPNSDWFFSANLPVLSSINDSIYALDPDGVDASNDETFCVTTEAGVQRVSVSTGAMPVGRWNSDATIQHFASERDQVFFFIVPGGYRVRGGLNVMEFA